MLSGFMFLSLILLKRVIDLITEAIFNIIFSFLDVLVGFLPTFTFPFDL